MAPTNRNACQTDASSGRPYPLTTTTLSVPGAKTVRSYSFFGDSYVCILFDDKTDPCWARSRVVEHLNQVQSRLPDGANAALGPDATGVGWVYECALVDGTGKTDIGQLRALNDWFLKFELKTVPDVAEVASIGGIVRQHQVVPYRDRMRALGITQSAVVQALQKANQSSGGLVVEMAETQYMVRSRGCLKSLDDFRTSAPARGAQQRAGHAADLPATGVEHGDEGKGGVVRPLGLDGVFDAAIVPGALPRGIGPRSHRGPPNWAIQRAIGR